MAVTEKYKGLGPGKQFIQCAIDKCKATGTKKIILYTAKKLEAACHLYTQFGFI